MQGETHLNTLLASLKPELQKGEYVFLTLAEAHDVDLSKAICTFREKEGLSVILPREIADKQHIEYSFIASWITLNVYSSLEATGLTAAISKALNDEKISCNAVAAFYHDHIFVAREDCDRAMDVLTLLQERHKG
jgi:uncharacterized protein